jgi:hypothetical protein
MIMKKQTQSRAYVYDHSLMSSLFPEKPVETLVLPLYTVLTVFRRALHGRDRVLVHNHEETLYSTYRLGLTLYITFLRMEREAKRVRRVECVFMIVT